MAEQMVRAGGDMAKLGGMMRKLVAASGCDKLAKGMTVQGQELVYSILTERVNCQALNCQRYRLMALSLLSLVTQREDHEHRQFRSNLPFSGVAMEPARHCGKSCQRMVRTDAHWQIFMMRSPDCAAAPARHQYHPE